MARTNAEPPTYTGYITRNEYANEGVTLYLETGLAPGAIVSALYEQLPGLSFMGINRELFRRGVAQFGSALGS